MFIIYGYYFSGEGFPMRLAGYFQDRMVLQRNKENHIWGWDDSESVTVIIEGEKYTGKCVDGQFNIVTKPMDTRVGIDITVEGSERIILHDCCIGDVFMLAGQSNMELPVSRTLDLSADLVSQADYPYLRQYRLIPDNDYKPMDEYKLSTDPWIAAVQGEIGEMSALGFFTFRHIYEKTGVPIGLILNAQGGSTIEAWMRREDLEDISDELGLIEENWGEGYLPAKVAAQYEEGERWKDKNRIFDAAEYASGIPSDAKEVQIPGMFRDLTGCSWFYKEFTLTEDVKSSDAFLYLGELVDTDVTYINGVEVGNTGYLYPPRKYPFKSSVLHKGKNLIAVRLITERNCGGFVPEHRYYIEVDGRRIDLRGAWKTIRESTSEENKSVRMMVMYPTVLYNGAINTLKGLSVKAFFWYQGESNCFGAETYNEKFIRMVMSWREIFGFDVPVVATIMPDYINPESEDVSFVPPEWKNMQHLQSQASSLVPGCYLVDGSDLGEPYELHPQRKVELGDRAAIVFSEVLGLNG